MNRRTKLGRGETQNGPRHQGARELHSNLASGDGGGAPPVPPPPRWSRGARGVTLSAGVPLWVGRAGGHRRTR